MFFMSENRVSISGRTRDFPLLYVVQTGHEAQHTSYTVGIWGSTSGGKVTWVGWG
jgi:hypothetical protein